MSLAFTNSADALSRYFQDAINYSLKEAAEQVIDQKTEDYRKRIASEVYTVLENIRVSQGIFRDLEGIKLHLYFQDKTETI